MKTKILRIETYFRIVVFTILLLFYGCSKEEYDSEVTEENLITELTNNSNHFEAKSRTVEGVAWAWFNGVSAPIQYQFNQSFDNIIINRISRGRYSVIFPGRASLNGGVIHTSAYGGNHSTQVQGWYASARGLEALIHSFGPDGNHIDGKFVILLYKKTRIPYITASDAYLLSNSTFRNFNSKEGENLVTRISNGNYFVKLNELEIGNANFSDGLQRRFHITPYGNEPVRAKIGYNFQGNNGANAIITTHDRNGNRIDSQFILSYNEFPSLVPSYSFNSRAIHYNGNSVIPSDSGVTVTYSGNGRYLVEIPLRNIRTTTSAVIVSSYGNESLYTNISSWYKTRSFAYINLRSYNFDGTPITQDMAKFNVLYLDDF